MPTHIWSVATCFLRLPIISSSCQLLLQLSISTLSLPNMPYLSKPLLATQVFSCILNITLYCIFLYILYILITNLVIPSADAFYCTKWRPSSALSWSIVRWGVSICKHCTIVACYMHCKPNQFAVYEV